MGLLGTVLAVLTSSIAWFIHSYDNIAPSWDTYSHLSTIEDRWGRDDTAVFIQVPCVFVSCVHLEGR